MSFITWEQFGGGAYAAGTAVGDLIRAAGGFYCDAIRQYPNWSLSNPLGLDPISRGINDRLCGGRPDLPLPDQPALPGGRCFCSRYRVFYEVDPDNAPPFTASYDTNGPISVLGWQSGLNPAAYDFRVISQNDSCNGLRTENLVANISQTAINNGYKVRVTNITPLAGAPDNCGGQVPKYDPIQPPINFLERNVNINLSPTIPIAIPVILVRPNVDITLSPNVNINLQPQFNFPDLGINIGFDLGGININNNIASPTINFGVPRDPRPVPPQLPPGQSVDTDLTELYRRVRVLQDQLADLLECACPPDKTLTPQTLGNGESGTFPLPAGTRFVILQLNTIPGNRKFQSGFNAPDVLYAGWAWFRNTLNSQSEREPVDASIKYFIPTPNSNAFCYTLYGGFSGTVIAYRESQ